MTSDFTSHIKDTKYALIRSLQNTESDWQ